MSGPDATRLFRCEATDKAESRRWYSLLSVCSKKISPQLPHPARDALAWRERIAGVTPL
ncbi:hypothetical protein MALGJ_10800 [Mycolicibacter algericus]|uniref:Uncharacterized protein n=1 Tax=Mycolicibacter algericus TaxID=1288388 RepID=A0A7I9Y730_MYCAL|nr:hypothetical protein MALGJ_10800 [Mycolicibacter algericus]